MRVRNSFSWLNTIIRDLSLVISRQITVRVAHLLPASTNRTVTFGSSERRDASTDPEVPCRGFMSADQSHANRDLIRDITDLPPQSHNRMFSIDFCHHFP